MKAIILAAGRGERMRPLTDRMPKPMLPVGGKPLIDYHVAALERAGIRDMVINLAWQGSRVVEHLGDGSGFQVRIVYSDEGAVALETGGGIFRALKNLGPEPFWVVNGDIYAEFDFCAHELAADVLAHLFLVPNPSHNSDGDFALGEGRIANTGDPLLTFSGISILRPALFDGCEDGVFSLTPLLRAAADQGRVTGQLLDLHWSDVGTPERLEAVDARLSKR
jgi:MurNAc alpha-1-phosphate uridylyltransferase